MEIMDLIVKAVGIAANKLRIEAPKVVKQDTNCEYVFDSLKYTIELSESFIKDNDELTVVGMAIHELRHAYQYIQIKFRDKLMENNIPTEDIKTINIWEKEFKNIKNENDWEMETEIDAFSFMTYFMKRVFNVEPIFEKWQLDLMEKKIKYFNIIYG